MQYRLNSDWNVFLSNYYYYYCLAKWNSNLLYEYLTEFSRRETASYVHKRHILEHDSEQPWNAYGLYDGTRLPFKQFHIKSFASISINESLSHGFLHSPHGCIFLIRQAPGKRDNVSYGQMNENKNTRRRLDGYGFCSFCISIQLTCVIYFHSCARRKHAEKNTVKSLSSAHHSIYLHLKPFNTNSLQQNVGTLCKAQVKYLHSDHGQWRLVSIPTDLCQWAKRIYMKKKVNRMHALDGKIIRFK